MTASGEEPDLNAIGDNHMPEDVRRSVRREHEGSETGQVDPAPREQSPADENPDHGYDGESEESEESTAD